MAAGSEVASESLKPMAYFSHDANASDDIKCKRLIRRLGMEGYGRWWRLCELLAATDGHRLDLTSAEDAEIVAEELYLGDIDALMAFLCTLKDVGLVQMPGDGRVWSERMLHNAEYFGKKRAAGRRGGRAKKVA